MLFRAQDPAASAEVTAKRIGAVFADQFERFGWAAVPTPPVVLPSVVQAGSEVLIEFDRVDSQDRFRVMLQSLVPGMDEAELQGMLLPAMPLAPHLRLPLMPVNALVAGIVLPSRMDSSGRPPTQNGWYVADALTERLLEFGQDWIQPSDGQLYFEFSGRSRPASLSQAMDQVKDHLYPATQVSVWAFNAGGYRRLTLSDHGHVNFEIAECDETWQPALDDLTGVLRAWAAAARYGLIRRTQGPGPGWAITIGSMPPAPQIAASYYVIAPGLEDSLVADPYGVQLLTARHLAGIQVPDTWTVETVADDRYLLTAPDPAEWFGIGRPYWATLNHSRGMFADSLMLNDDVARVRQAPHEPDVGTLPGT